MSDSLRYARQMLLVEIGEKGQLLLEAATAVLGGEGLDHEVAEAYARRAGMRSVAQGVINGALAPSYLENPSCRAVVAGSRAALSAVRAALAMPSGGGQP